MFKIVARALVAAAALALAAPASAQAPVAAGTLTCDVSAGFGVIVGSRRAVSCTFAPSQPGPVEYYTGTITKVGIDIGATSSGIMVWLVYAPTARPAGALSGTYAGATAEATFAVGLGANVLVGGSNRTIALQPVSVQGQVGLNLAAGVAELDLRFAR
ncbi:MAG TPA: DUF992 domain-containing protein [Xanthobacteraceae bacterium]|nr:DUF992 domain-containing protein [Xanthobacteraceae bacterium]